jgi:Protein of unknown function (DUF3300)
MNNKFNAMVTATLIAALALIFCAPVDAQRPPSNFEGNWTMYAVNEQGQTVEKHVQIAQYGTQITGYFEGPFQSGPILGEVVANRIHFITQTKNPLNFHGEMFGDNITGTCIYHGNTTTWSAVRTTGIGAPQSIVTYAQPQVAVPTPVQNQIPNPVPTYSWQTPQQQQQSAQPTYSQPQQNTYNQQPQQQQQQYSDNSQQSNNNNNNNNNNAPQEQSQQQQSNNSAPAPAPMTSEQLNSLVAPIALYPDSLVAQILGAAQNPDEITDANSWLGQNSNLTGQDLANAVNQQSWDPSVKALTQFPTVLANLANNLQWTSSLGQAFYYQQSDVMAAVQVMRAKAQAAGTLQSNSQVTVTQPSTNTIVIQPANPQVVYVPQYNPTIVYGAPIAVPLYTPPVVVATPTIGWSAGISIGAWFGGGGGTVAVGGGFNWGWGAWGCNWGGGGGGGNTIIFNNNTYIHNNTWHTNNYNGYHNWGPGGTRPGGYVGPNGYYHPDPGYRPGTDTHYGPNGAYHPNGYYGPDGGWHQDPSSRNGGDNGNHGLIGGNGGVQHPVNGPGDQPNGGHNGDHGLVGGNGGVQHQPDGGRNGDHGMIGGNGGVQHDADRGQQNRQLAQSRMSGDGRVNRTESNRGQRSMSHPRPVHESHPVHTHAPASHPSGGEHRH